MGKFKLGGHGLPGPNQKASIGKARDVFRTFYDEEGNEQTEQISRAEMADVKKNAAEKGEVLNTDVKVGNSFRTTTSGADQMAMDTPETSYTFTDQDAVDEIKSNIDSNDRISQSETNEQLLKQAQTDVDKKKNIKLSPTSYGSSNLQNISKQGGSRNINQREAAKFQDNTFTANPEDVENVAELRNKDKRRLNLLDFNKAENEKLNKDYQNRTAGSKTGPSKNMKFGRKKK